MPQAYEPALKRFSRTPLGRGLLQSILFLMVMAQGPWYPLVRANPFDGDAFAFGVVRALEILVPAARAQALACDIDLDADVDINDINLISARRNQPAAGPDDPADIDGDGVITLNDSRQCVLQCTLPRCAVVAPNQPPAADAGPDQTVQRGDTVLLDGNASADPDGDALSFAWTFLSRPAGSGAILAGAASTSPSFVGTLRSAAGG